MKHIISTTIALLALTLQTSAGGCGGVVPCGEVENRSRHTMKYTTKFADDRSGPHFCDTWNHGGGNTVKNYQVSCKQESLVKAVLAVAARTLMRLRLRIGIISFLSTGLPRGRSKRECGRRFRIWSGGYAGMMLFWGSWLVRLIMMLEIGCWWRVCGTVRVARVMGGSVVI
jgi:hypothetical protein